MARPERRTKAAALPPRGGVLDPVATWREAAYGWPCPHCDCRRNLRGLLREVCANCGHCHPPPEETPHVR